MGGSLKTGSFKKGLFGLTPLGLETLANSNKISSQADSNYWEVDQRSGAFRDFQSLLNFLPIGRRGRIRRGKFLSKNCGPTIILRTLKEIWEGELFGSFPSFLGSW